MWGYYTKDIAAYVDGYCIAFTFRCILIANTRGHMWLTVDNTLPPAITATVGAMLQEEKPLF